MFDHGRLPDVLALEERLSKQLGDVPRCTGVSIYPRILYNRLETPISDSYDLRNMIRTSVLDEH